MPRSRVGFSGASRSLGRFLRRKTSWDSGPGGTTIGVLSAGGLGVIGSVQQATTDGLTLVRLRGQLTMWLQAATAAGDGFTGAFGIGIAEQNALAIGSTAIPSPVTDRDWDGWIFWHPVQLFAGVAAETFGNAGSPVDRVIVDSKSMRKLDIGDGLFAVVELVLEGAATAEFTFDSRALLKLP